MEKSADAFRTISEVADDLVLPQHVLRFWEQRFPQIRPLKRAGGRRYYRPADVVLLRSIRQLLHDEGYTIKGVQRLLKEQGARGLRVSESTTPLEPGEWAEVADEHTATVSDAGELRAMPEVALIHGHARAEPSLDRDGLHEALTVVEDCERILLALHRPRG